MSDKRHIFNAGPCLLPQEVLGEVSKAITDFNGLPLLCISHRSAQWVEIMDETRALWKEILNIPDTHEVVFLSSGAQMEFLYVAMNYLEKKAGYLDTGRWANKAMEQAQKLAKERGAIVSAVASSQDSNYSRIPKGFSIPTDLDYLHITTNNTVVGTQIREDLSCPVPLVADMSSDILSRPVDVSKYAMIYGGAQKNAGTAGATFAIVRKDSLGKVSHYIPDILNLQSHIDAKSMYNTPPVFAIYVMNRTLHWVKEQGGVEEMQRRARIKSKLLYDEIDSNPLFEGTVVKEDRSRMNACFVMAPGCEKFEKPFLEFAQNQGMVGIKGHRSVGGFRASIYNACSVEDVQALVDCMKEFANQNN